MRNLEKDLRTAQGERDTVQAELTKKMEELQAKDKALEEKRQNWPRRRKIVWPP